MNAGHKFLGPVKYNLENFIYIGSTTWFSRPVRVVGIINQLLLNWIELGINIDSHFVLKDGKCVAIWQFFQNQSEHWPSMIICIA